MSLLFDKSNQFHKLSRTDRLICLSVLTDNPKDIAPAVRYIAEPYGDINIKELLQELLSFQEHLSKMDSDLSNQII